MGGSQKSKRVTWATDVNLCQVRLFLSEECPSQVGLVAQDHLQAKTLWLAQAGGVGPDDNLPPGFEGIQTANPWIVKLSQVSLVKWKCPPKFEINSSWRVVAGEESREAETENQREMRVLEAIYPRPSAIPPNPSALVGVEDSINNDQYTPLVPITAIEDEDASLDASYGPMISQQPHSSSHGTFPLQPNSTANSFSATGVEPDIVAAAQAALSSVMPNGDRGNLIDRGLLIKILSDPKMIEQLITNHATSSTGQTMASSSTTQSMSSSSSSFHGMPSTSTSTQYIPNLSKSSFDPTNIGINRRDPVNAQITRPELVAPSMATSAGPFYPPSSRMAGIPILRPSAPDAVGPITKDINYYKSLIQQHGGERREMMPQFGHQGSQVMGTNQEPMNMMMKSRELKPKIMKPCIYFNSSRGCRNGANCSYQHDITTQQKVNNMPEVQTSKRMKMDREITGA